MILAKAEMMLDASETVLPTNCTTRGGDMRIARVGSWHVAKENIAEKIASRVKFDLTFFLSAV
jgi:hypothetical protein